MRRYFFDLRHGDQIVADEEGIVLRDLGAVQTEAMRCLVTLAGDFVER